MPLNAAALAALTSIRTNRELVFPGFPQKTWFYKNWHKLLDLAGIDRAKHFGLHAIRANGAGMLWETSPAVAKFVLGHRSIGTTSRHYVNGTSMVARALEALPMPFGLPATTWPAASESLEGRSPSPLTTYLKHTT